MDDDKGTRGRPGPDPKGRSRRIYSSLTPSEYDDTLVTAAKRGLRIPAFIRTLLGLEP